MSDKQSTKFQPGDKVRSVDEMPDDAGEWPWFFEYMLSLRGTVAHNQYLPYEGYLVRCNDGGEWFFRSHWLRHDTEED